MTRSAIFRAVATTALAPPQRVDCGDKTPQRILGVMTALPAIRSARAARLAPTPYRRFEDFPPLPFDVADTSPASSRSFSPSGSGSGPSRSRSKSPTAVVSLMLQDSQIDAAMRNNKARAPKRGHAAAASGALTWAARPRRRSGRQSHASTFRFPCHTHATAAGKTRTSGNACFKATDAPSASCHKRAGDLRASPGNARGDASPALRVPLAAHDILEDLHPRSDPRCLTPPGQLHVHLLSAFCMCCTCWARTDQHLRCR